MGIKPKVRCLIWQIVKFI